MPEQSNSYLRVDLDALRLNVRAWRSFMQRGTQNGAAASHAKSPRLMAVVKSDAYGLGLEPIVQTLAHEGVEGLAVYSLEQAAEVASILPNHPPMMVLMPAAGGKANGELAEAARTQRLRLSIHDRDEVKAAAAKAKRWGCRLPVEIYLDTGMSRAGVRSDSLGAVIDAIEASDGLRLAGMWTHFAAAQGDVDFTREQMAAFEQAVRAHRERFPNDALFHVASTFGALRDRRYHLDQLRLGLGLFGFGPELIEGEAAEQPPALQPVLRWMSRIIHVQHYTKGSTVGYDRTHRLERDSVLGVVPVGYGDGYPLGLSNRGSVEVLAMGNGEAFVAPLLGKVNMDQIVIDLTDAREATVGLDVVLVSDVPSSPCALPRLASLAGSHCYEMLCRLPSRLPRVYVDAGDVGKEGQVELDRGKVCEGVGVVGV